MQHSPIYTTEPMVTRALAAEIRHDPHRFVRLLLERSGATSFGDLRQVRCEAEEQVDILLEFDTDGPATRSVGIEAKFDHELSRDQITRELRVTNHLFVLVADVHAIPRWLTDDFPTVSVISWDEALACFTSARITVEDLASIRLLKATVESHLNRLRFDELTDWTITTARGGSGMPSIVFESPELPDGRTLRGQLQVSGRRMPGTLEAVRFESHIGVAVPEDDENYFDPATSDDVPGWIEHLRTLHREVLDGEEDRLLISRRAPGSSTRPLGRWKTPLARIHLGELAYLAKGYTDGWAIGPKTLKVGLDRLEELAGVSAEMFRRWYDAELTR